MNKLLKGSIAGAAGVALLLGGAGTFALWNDDATVDGGTIVAGNLDLATDLTSGEWSDANGTIDLSTFVAVPGDVLTYTTDVDVTATGDNLVATLGLGTASITASSSAAADVALAGYLTNTAVLSATGTGISGLGPTYTIEEGTGVATVTVEITFPKHPTAGAENSTKNGSVSLADLSVTLTQD
ncbi:alternate-type signal peptide domain-containing protein [Cryobacterium sp. Sr8]|uniref:Alternate signal-mediated exported protein, RER_14450 family n=1 Tax=Cryobacterium psychrotolerans TaxID=386301 RepID=A0A1G9DAD7_9MICO|nr:MULTISPECIES: alternate-type signal peptide domain-containing protein [Cryobacterium]TFD47237.1 alternate-type signal peptide domain-containing protein [Cryobacterium sp. TMT1-2-1]TFD74568.1 alternate-type signal peptide domain-containing protein [Cryobacterium sp. Sr8]TFD90334.1 alternate-type signal peptide domain-containing protein [Cryobacterium psychrotolerans]SDK60851.1 alternate signal-mediated exported protein, RER_14450 family [Cryobacterium psychrotolerans]